MIRWLAGLWHAHQRDLDIRILWPICCEMAADRERAKAAFAMHAFHDPAWCVLGEHGIYEIIDKLEGP